MAGEKAGEKAVRSPRRFSGEDKVLLNFPNVYVSGCTQTVALKDWMESRRTLLKGKLLPREVRDVTKL